MATSSRVPLSRGTVLRDVYGADGSITEDSTGGTAGTLWTNNKTVIIVGGVLAVVLVGIMVAKRAS